MKIDRAKTSLFAGLLAAYAGLMLANPVFPPLARELGLTEVQAGMVISAAALVFALASPFWGWLSDRTGRKLVFVIGLVGIAISFLMFAVAGHLGLIGALSGAALLAALFATRVILGALVGAVPVSAQAYMADVTGAADRSAGMALIGAANGLGTLLGPALAAFLVTFGLLTPFYAGAAIALFAALALSIFMPPSPRQQSMDQPPRIMPWDRRVWPFLFLGFATVTVIVLLQITLGFYLIDRFSLTPVDAAQTAAIGLLVVGMALAVVQGVFVTRYKWSPRTLLRSGSQIMGLGLICAVLAPSLLLLIAAFAVMGIAGGLLFPGFTSGASLAVSDDEQGAIAGLNSAASGVGAVIGPLIGTALYQAHITAPYIASAVLFVVLVVFVWVHPKVKHAITQDASAKANTAGEHSR
ncbi:MFS transporter [Rhodophyticola porphyridii]|uniref:MFS transporter n=1 Tax=Rhodophyticola porphyridii TaxID=1852017 RepID=A0A3L9Y075_9RHOB|nr:MFS transporter [Rhodophyticola porphyridii]RMA40608.1 MFS transporter [Rhodophyticola porphyridii]